MSRSDLLREMLAELDAMPEKRLITSELTVLGVVGSAPLVREMIEFEDDDGISWPEEPPESRWFLLRAWVASQIAPGDARPFDGLLS